MKTVKGVFVTGTDTGVGKTLVSSALIRRLVQMRRLVGVMKPVETGVHSNQLSESDAGRLMAAAGMADGIDEVSPYRFSAPLAPLAAASAEGQVIDFEAIMRRCGQLAACYSCVVVEGAGGLLVPMGKDWDMGDLISRLGLPVVLVGRAGLGGINHALLTLEALERRQIPVLALVLNETVLSSNSVEQEQRASTIALLQERVAVPVLGPIPYQSGLDCAWRDAVEQLAGSRPISELAESLWKAVAGTS